MNKTVIAIVVVVLIALGAGGFLLTRKSADKDTSTTATSTAQTPTTSSQTNTQSQDTTAANQTAAATITYTDSGFTPSQTTVKAGSVVAVKNDSSHDLELDSGPHPVHTSDPDLNIGSVPKGQTRTFTVTKTGTFEFHNHLNNSDEGHITVE